MMVLKKENPLQRFIRFSRHFNSMDLCFSKLSTPDSRGNTVASAQICLPLAAFTLNLNLLKASSVSKSHFTSSYNACRDGHDG